ncbi:MAG: hypothetical protein RIM99_13380 [Cyclobacteriaceae bacterium]
MKNSIQILLVTALMSCGGNRNSITEFDEKWNLHQVGSVEWMSSDVPGVVHMDLLKNRKIEDPYLGNNELNLQWIEKENWEYRSSWRVSKEQLRNDHIELVFTGLDTYAEVRLNGEKILTADNMFRSWRVDARPFLKEGDNELIIHFTSPLGQNEEQVKNYPYRLPSGNETTDLQVSAFTRKAAYQFGWDWGPRFVSSGIWRPIYVEAWNDARITHSFVSTQSIAAEKALIQLSISIESDIEAMQTLLVGDQKMEVELIKGINDFTFPMEISQPKLWWPNGHGNPHMYNLDLKLLIDGELRDERSVNYGIRTIQLINEPDSIGTSFYFKVNGEAVFVKGANYIPQDIFPSRVKAEKYEALISKAKEANMNMLRVWGGGIYEDDYFYELCDKNGIMVWQDFMFAGSMYPTDEAFHSTVKNEVRDNINRLRPHPSIALWCGNNEIDVAWKNWGWQTQFGYSEEDSVEIWNNYLRLFHEEIPEEVERLNPLVNYVTTSPLSNWGTPENFNHSSMHYWGVWHGREPFENFKDNVPRFMAEYGFQSFPSYESLAKLTDTSSLSLDSEFISNRQKSYIGNDMITRFSEKYFGKAKDFKSYIENSQKTQALAMKMAIQEHRLNKPHCMGTLFWQLNDVWQGPSWSVLEYDGKPKLAYEEVKKWYQDVVVITRIQGDTVSFHVVSDCLTGFTGELSINISGTDGSLRNHNIDVSLEKNEVKKVFEIISRIKKYRLQLNEDGEVIFEDTNG